MEKKCQKYDWAFSSSYHHYWDWEKIAIFKIIYMMKNIEWKLKEHTVGTPVTIETEIPQ